MFRKIIFMLMVAVLLSTVTTGAVSAGQNKVTVCHKPGTPAEATLEVSAAAEAAHLGHGDYAGECQGPQSAGCEALNAIVPDSQTDPSFYYFEVSTLDFFAGETIHVDMTVTALEEEFWHFAEVHVQTGSGTWLASDDSFGPEQTVTVSLDYVVVDGDDADGVGMSVLQGGYEGFTVDSASVSCTPA